MNFIKKIFCDKDYQSDRSVSLQFQKFSRGKFQDKAIISAKKTAKKYKINTSPEFANEFVRIVAEKLGDEKTLVKGAIVSTIDLTNELDFKDKKQFQGVKRYILEKEMTGKEILDLMNKFPKVFFGLSFNVKKENIELKIKPKAPKSGKPSTKKDEAPKADFCKLSTEDSKIAKSFVFEKPDFKSAFIKHTYFIDEIIIPEELKKTNDFARMREEATRKGRILREAEIDGNKIKKEINFAA